MLVSLPGFLFNQLAEIDPVSYPQDKAGGEIPTPSVAAILVPCCVQQDDGPGPTGTQGRRGSSAPVRVFLRPSDAPGIAAVQALKSNDRLKVAGPIATASRTIVLDGPAFDAAGRGAVWEARGEDIR